MSTSLAAISRQVPTRAFNDHEVPEFDTEIVSPPKADRAENARHDGWLLAKLNPAAEQRVDDLINDFISQPGFITEAKQIIEEELQPEQLNALRDKEAELEMTITNPLELKVAMTQELLKIVSSDQAEVVFSAIQEQITGQRPKNDDVEMVIDMYKTKPRAEIIQNIIAESNQGTTGTGELRADKIAYVPASPPADKTTAPKADKFSDEQVAPEPIEKEADKPKAVNGFRAIAEKSDLDYDTRGTTVQPPRFMAV